MKRIIIFDLDGTLLNTLFDLHSAVNGALKDFGYAERSVEQIRKAIGNGVAKLIERSIPNGLENPNYKDCLEKFREIYKVHYYEKTEAYPKVLDTCIQFKSKGFKLAVATNKTRSIAIKIINDFYPNVFDYVQGDEEGISRKPAPDMVNKILNLFNISKSEAVYVGDTDVDEQTALNAGVDYYLVTYGYRTKEELLVQCPKAQKIDSIEELLSIY